MTTPRTFVRIDTDVTVQDVFTVDKDLPPMHQDALRFYVDVTSIKPIPKVGDDYDPVHGTFSTPLQTPPSFQNLLKQQFATLLAAHSGDLTDVQLADVISTATSVDKALSPEYQAVLGLDQKRTITGLITGLSGLPDKLLPVKQQLIDFVNANYKPA